MNSTIAAVPFHKNPFSPVNKHCIHCIPYIPIIFSSNILILFPLKSHSSQCFFISYITSSHSHHYIPFIFLDSMTWIYSMNVHYIPTFNNQWIGLRANICRNASYLMGTSMVSGDHIPFIASTIASFHHISEPPTLCTSDAHRAATCTPGCRSGRMWWDLHGKLGNWPI